MFFSSPNTSRSQRLSTFPDDTGRQHGGALRRPALLLIGAMLALAALWPAASQAAPFAYVTNNSGNDVSQYDASGSGLLAPLSPATEPAGNGPGMVAISPDGLSAYVANIDDGEIAQYDVGTGGLLTPKTPATVTAGTQPTGIVVSPDGNSVYVANQGSDDVSQYDVGIGGVLTPKSPATEPAGGFAVGVAVSPDGTSVYVTNGFDDNIRQYDVGIGGVLAPKTPAVVSTGGFPVGVVVSPDGTSVYVVNGGGDDNISQYNVGVGGVLAPKTPATVATGSGPQLLAMSPDGASLYAPTLDDNVSQYDVGLGGLLAPKTPATVPTGSSPFGVAVSPPPGTINVVKDAVPDDAQDFAFTAGGGLTPSTFSLDDDANGTLSNTQTFTGVGPGSGYSISETVPSGWDQTAATCNDGSPVTNIDVSTGETVTCTFTNNKIFGYARPKSATPINIRLVPAFEECISDNASHGAPASVPSCSPPQAASDYLTVGTPDANGKAPASMGVLTLQEQGESPIIPGNGDQADVAITASLTDVRNQSDLSDYGGELRFVLGLRITDRYNGAPLEHPATVTDTPLAFSVLCLPSGGPEGSACNVTTTADGVMSDAGFAREGQRAVWELGQVQVFDGGADEDADSAGDNTLFEVQGTFAP